MKRMLLFSFSLFIIIHSSFCQSVGIGTNTPDPSAQVDISSTNKGALMPRMTTAQRKAIASPAFGLMVFDTDKATVMFYDGASWKAMSFTDENTSLPQKRVNNDAQAGALFGSHVSISGDYAIIGAPDYTNPGITYMGVAYIFFRGTNGWQQQARLSAFDSSAFSYFGGAVAIAGDYAAVSAAGKTIGGNNAQGKVYIYKRNGTNWIRDTVFTKSSGAANDNFGSSLALSVSGSGGPMIAIGIPYSDFAGSDKGEVYTYRRNLTTGTWSFLQNLLPSDLAIFDNFGLSLTIDGDYLAAGAPNQDYVSTSTFSNAGAIYIYVYGGGAWTMQQKIPNSIANAQFGASMSISGDKIAIGSPWASPFSNTSAAVYIYRRSGAVWSNLTSIYLLNYEGGAASNVFGGALALEGNNLLIGTPGGLEYANGGETYYSTTIGSVYFYKSYDGTNFIRIRQQKADMPDYLDMFGEAIALSNGNYIIGSPRSNTNDKPIAGHVVFGMIGN